MDTLPKDIIGHLLTFLPYHDWAILQRTSKRFWHEKHNNLRKIAKEMFLGTSLREDQTIYLQIPILSFKGYQITPSMNRLHTKMEEVFGETISSDYTIFGEAIFCCLFNLPITRLDIHVPCFRVKSGSQLLEELYSLVKVPIKQSVFIHGQLTTEVRVECDGVDIVMLTDVHKKYTLKWTPGNEWCETNRDGLWLITKGASSDSCHTFQELERLKKHNLYLCRKGAQVSSIVAARNVQCNYPDMKGIRRTDVKFTFVPRKKILLEKNTEHGSKKRKQLDDSETEFEDDFKEEQTNWPDKERFLMLVEYNGHKVDLLTREVYDPKQRVITGRMGLDGEVEKHVLKRVDGDTMYDAMKKCPYGHHHCGHCTWWKPYTGRLKDVKNMRYIGGMRDAYTTSDPYNIILMLRNHTLIPDIPLDELFRKVYGAETIITTQMMTFLNNFYRATDNNADWWTEQFKAEGAYDYFQKNVRRGKRGKK